MTSPDSHPFADSAADGTEHALLRLEHGDIHVCQDGPRDAPALLLLHGSATSGRSWDALVPLLVPAHRVIRIDLPGHGRSSEPVGRGYATSEQARTLGAVLDRLRVGQVVAIGHSSGGCAATALAEERPDLVTALALINTGPGMDAFIAPASAPIDPARWPPSDEQIRRFASTGFREGYQVPRELIDELRGMSPHAITAAMQASIAYLNQRALPARLAALGKPLRVIFGEQDRRWRPSSAEDYRVVPGAEIDLLPGAGHTPILEEPVRTAELLLPFTKLHATGTPRGATEPGPGPRER
ncbi:alpha/beta hydrolase [Streptomyces pactum]|uniref:Alpha/beta hydrolase n=1 Tax=Streptomyces pactum TaxID=68249 RepID=A0ABS0NEZ4_9ACTN|nr:alpha/beta hydrolase [Streptomyces pactum]MBH5333736.1 alpha/beta hydrolase [Streptomyces pactum]